MEDTTSIATADPLLRREDVAVYLDVSPKTLEHWATQGRGPDFIRIGRLVRYPKSELDRWLVSQTVTGDAA